MNLSFALKRRLIPTKNQRADSQPCLKLEKCWDFSYLKIRKFSTNYSDTVMRFDIHPVCRLKYFRIWSRFCGDILHVSLTELNLIICICYCSNYKKKFHKNVDPVCHDSNSFGHWIHVLKYFLKLFFRFWRWLRQYDDIF